MQRFFADLLVFLEYQSAQLLWFVAPNVGGQASQSFALFSTFCWAEGVKKVLAGLGGLLLPEYGSSYNPLPLKLLEIKGFLLTISGLNSLIFVIHPHPKPEKSFVVKIHFTLHSA